MLPNDFIPISQPVGSETRTLALQSLEKHAMGQWFRDQIGALPEDYKILAVDTLRSLPQLVQKEMDEKAVRPGIPREVTAVRRRMINFYPKDGVSQNVISGQFEDFVVGAVREGINIATAIGNSFDIPQLDDESVRERTYPKVHDEVSGTDRR